MSKTLSPPKIARSEAAPEHPGTASRDMAALIIPAIVGLVLFASTLLLCDTPSTAGHWPLRIDRFLAAPIELSEPSDLRLYAIPVGLAVLLFVMAGRGRSTGIVSTRSASWFEILGALTVGWACASAWKNNSWDQSRGWIFSLACGVAWAALLGRIYVGRCFRGTFLIAAAVAAIGAALSLAHRQLLGEAYYQLPIGPITLTASLGALWAAMAVVWLGAIIARRWSAQGNNDDRTAPAAAAIVAAAILAIFSLTLLAASARRGAWLGLLTGVGVAAVAASWTYSSSRRSQSIVTAIALAVLTAMGAYVWSQSRSADIAVSLPLKYRSIYWGKMQEMIPKSPIWGQGPDEFVVKMTTAMARQRAEQPTILHGAVDYEGHNEWLQAIYELGIPGGLLYLALPMGTIVAGWRAWRRENGAARLSLLALMAGLVTLCVSETTSINLRHPILQGWYWTLLGLTLALARESAVRLGHGSQSCASRKRIVVRMWLCAAAFIIVLSLR